MNKQKKYLESKKNLTQENIKLKIDYEVMRRQLISIRNTLNEILGDTSIIEEEEEKNE